MRTRTPLGTAFLLLLVGGCDPNISAHARAALLAPLDPVCLQDALSRRYGPADMRPTRIAGTGTSPTEVWLYYGHASFTQTYSDSGLATLSASKTVSTSIFAALSPPRARMDSVGKQLGNELLAARDACGGRPPANVPEITVGR